MAFIQIVEYSTNRIDEVRQLGEKYQADTAGRRSNVRATICGDRDTPNRYAVIAEFPSYEAAMENSNLPETQAFAAAMGELCDGPPTFHNLDVIETMEG